MTNWPIPREVWLDLTAVGGNASVCLTLLIIGAGLIWLAWNGLRRKR